MRLMQGAVQFQLTKPSKSYTACNCNNSKKLQIITIKAFEGDWLLCPLDTLMAYLEKTKYRRDEIDNLFVLVTTQNPRGG